MSQGPHGSDFPDYSWKQEANKPTIGDGKFERRRLRVYVAGPITSDPMRGVFRGIEAGRRLFQDGLAPFMPHADAFWFLGEGHWAAYMTYDLEFVAVCEAVYRLSGASKGADKEVAVAQELGKPVFYEDRDEYGRLMEYARNRRLVDAC